MAIDEVQLFSETAEKVFTSEFQTFLKVLTSTCIENEKLKKETEVLCTDIGKLLDGKNLRCCLTAILFHVLSISSTDNILATIDRIRVIERDKKNADSKHVDYFG